ncbi:MAG: T9SS type A sorting domain-containing protein, partial [Bacteroidales bacterium]|nr:T9SS type A sorting domain-containing protein [Bacteroidales bacterium]
VIAKYTEPECYSPPAKAKYNDEYFVMVCNSTDVADNTIQNVEIYPNPAKDVVKVSTVNSQRSTVKVYNYLGILVEEIELDAEEIELDVSDYNPGIYFFNVNGKTMKVTIDN